VQRTTIRWAGIVALLGAATIAFAACGSSSGDRPAAPTRTAAELYTVRGKPSGAFAGRRPRALVIMVHGGGWSGVGAGVVHSLDTTAQLLNSQGYETLNVDYRPGRRSFDDVLAFYDRARRRLGRRYPICMLGASAGGQLSLMVALRRPDVACVIAFAAPTDLVSIGGTPKADLVHRAAVDAFGARDLAEWSPARRRGAIRSPILLFNATTDPAIPYQQALDLRRAQRDVTLVRLRPGPAGFVHSSVDQRDAARAPGQMYRFLSRVTHALR
jgi:dipeptidyl aminopeptidase/acylaminoacyl peptidase